MYGLATNVPQVILNATDMCMVAGGGHIKIDAYGIKLDVSTTAVVREYALSFMSGSTRTFHVGTYTDTTYGGYHLELANSDTANVSHSIYIGAVSPSTQNASTALVATRSVSRYARVDLDTDTAVGLGLTYYETTLNKIWMLANRLTIVMNNNAIARFTSSGLHLGGRLQPVLTRSMLPVKRM